MAIILTTTRSPQFKRSDDRNKNPTHVRMWTPAERRQWIGFGYLEFRKKKTKYVSMCGSPFVSHSAGKFETQWYLDMQKCEGKDGTNTETIVSANNRSIHFAAGAFRIRIRFRWLEKIYIKGSNDNTDWAREWQRRTYALFSLLLLDNFHVNVMSIEVWNFYFKYVWCVRSPERRSEMCLNIEWPELYTFSTRFDGTFS